MEKEMMMKHYEECLKDVQLAKNYALILGLQNTSNDVGIDLKTMELLIPDKTKTGKVKALYAVKIKDGECRTIYSGKGEAFGISELRDFIVKPLYITNDLLHAATLKDAGHMAVAAMGEEQKLIDTLKTKTNLTSPIISLLSDEHNKALTDAGFNVTKPSRIDFPLATSKEGAAANRQGFEKELSKLAKLSSGHLVGKDESMLDCLAENDEMIAAGLGTPIKTGIDIYDEILGGLYPTRTTVIGADTGVGKSALALNIAANIAKQGYEVHYFSLELGKMEIQSRLIARDTLLSYQQVLGSTLNNVKSMTDLTDLDKREDWEDNDKAVVSKARELYKSYAGNIYAHTGDVLGMATLSIDEISKKIETRIEKGVRPIIVIDYLQIMPGAEDTERERIDRAVLGLKMLAAKHKITVLILSAVTKAFFGAELSAGCFKGSGGIDYTVDVAIVLQLQLPAGTKKDDVNKEIEAAKRKKLRGYDAKVIKNRIGEAGIALPLLFYAKCGHFDQATKIERLGIALNEEQELPY